MGGGGGKGGDRIGEVGSGLAFPDSGVGYFERELVVARGFIFGAYDAGGAHN